MLCVGLIPGMEGEVLLTVTIRQLLQCLNEKIPAFLFAYSEGHREGVPPMKTAIGSPIIRVYVEGDSVTIYTADPEMKLTATGLDTNIVVLAH